MNNTFLAKILTGFAITLGVTTINTQSSMAQNNKYTCAQLNGNYQTFLKTTRGNIPMISWVSDNWSELTPKERCITVSQRFQTYSDAGLLRYLRTGNANNQRVICAAQFRGGECSINNVLITLKSDQNAGKVLEELLNLRRRTGAEGIRLSGEVSSYDQGEFYIDMDKFVEKI